MFSLTESTIISEPGWTKDWPTKPGLYWFFGWLSEFAIRNDREPRLEIVKAMEAGPPEKQWMSFVSNGGFVYKSEGAKGFFKPMDLPELPDMSQL
jgi:hypothetical protein